MLGSIGFHSAGVGFGTTFFFELSLYAPTEEENSTSDGSVELIPLDLKTNDAVLKETKVPKESALNSVGNIVHVLIVDDSQMNRKMTRRMLQSEGILSSCSYLHKVY